MSDDAIKKAFDEGGSEAARKIKDALGDLAGTLAGGKTRSDFTSVDTAGGSEDYKKLQADSSRIRTDTQMATTAGDMMKMYNDKFYEGLRDKHLEGLTPGTAAYKKAVGELQEAKVLDASGHINHNYDERFRGLIQATKGNMAGMHGITIGSASYNISGGVGGVNDDVRISKDTSTTDTSGHQKVIKTTDAKTRNTIRSAKAQGVSAEDVADAKEQITADRSVVDRGTSALAARRVKAKQNVQKSKNNPKADKPNTLDKILNNDDLVDDMITEVELASIVGLPVVAEKAFNVGTGRRIAKEDFTYVDKNGKMQTKVKGDRFKLDEIPKDQRDFAKQMSNVEDTRITKMAKGGWEGLTDGVRKLTAGKSIFNSEDKTVNSSTDSGNQKNSTNNKSKFDDNVKHDNSFHSNSTSNSTKTTENAKDAAEEKVKNAKNTIDSIDKDMKDLANTPNKQVTRDKMAEIVKQHLEDAAPGSDEQKALRSLKSKISNKSARLTPQDFEDAGIGTHSQLFG